MGGCTSESYSFFEKAIRNGEPRISPARENGVQEIRLFAKKSYRGDCATDYLLPQSDFGIY
jgi:hypothetical protein